jgi:hypothetical protein
MEETTGARSGCIDWYQVLQAGQGGSLGALSSEGNMIASIPLTPTYIMAYLVYGDTPAEVNMNLLSAFGLADEYQTALNNPNFYAGQKGGDAGMMYISLASFFKGLPNLGITSAPVSSPVLQGGLFANRLVLTLPGIEAIGGSGSLVYIGTAGMLSQPSMMSGGNSSSQTAPPEVQKYLDRLPSNGSTIVVQPGEINYRMLADLHRAGQTEFALVKTSSGELLLVRGDITVGYPSGTVEIVAHTHHWSGLYPSNKDIEVLRKLQQPSSVIVTENRAVIKFYINGKYDDLGYLP